MSIKRTGFLLAAALFAASPLAALAGDLTIINNTAFDSTTITNNGFCSARILGENGISRAGQTHVIADSLVRKGCMLNKHQCHAAVYMNATCTGEIYAHVIFDVDTGIQSVTLTNPDTNPFIITGSGFTTQLDSK
jgi:hypothetical protein